VYVIKQQMKGNVVLCRPLRNTLGEEVRLHSFLTSALDGGKRLTQWSGHFTSGTNPSTIEQEAWWAPGPVWTVSEMKSVKLLTGFEPRAVQTAG
jgi:hypothetical protein